MVLLAAQSATGQDLVAAVKREHGDWLRQVRSGAYRDYYRQHYHERHGLKA